jgi:hypothetical protein
LAVKSYDFLPFFAMMPAVSKQNTTPHDESGSGSGLVAQKAD